jgi:hypothetical protein
MTKLLKCLGCKLVFVLFLNLLLWKIHIRDKNKIKFTYKKNKKQTNHMIKDYGMGLMRIFFFFLTFWTPFT